MRWRFDPGVVILLLLTCPAAGGQAIAAGPREEAGPSSPQPTVSERLLASLEPAELQDLVAEVLARNPELAAMAAQAEAANHRVAQARALPDPMASATAFVEPPETRTGPQRLSLSLSQGLPWFGKRSLRERAALLGAEALAAEVEGQRLALVTETRRLYLELVFLDRFAEINQGFHTHLLRHEEIARARYATGSGLGQAVVKLQAEITRTEKELLSIEARRVSLVSRINAKRDRDAVPVDVAPDGGPLAELAPDAAALTDEARRNRPEIAAAAARQARAGTMLRLAEKGYRPDVSLGIAYTLVDRRGDPAGVAQPPQGNGDDIFGLQAGITLPVRRQKLAASVDEAVAAERAAGETKRAVDASIEATIGDLALRLPLEWRQLRLAEDLLTVQAEESLESAQAGYIAGTLNALDLLDAEHVLFDAHTAVARARTDYLIGLAELEGAVAAPLAPGTPTE